MGGQRLAFRSSTDFIRDDGIALTIWVENYAQDELGAKVQYIDIVKKEIKHEC